MTSPLGFKARVGSLISGGSRICPRRSEPTLQGAPTYDFAKFSQKLHEIKRIWAPGGTRPSRPTLDPPLFIHTWWSCTRYRNFTSGVTPAGLLAIQHCSRIDLFDIPLSRHWWGSKLGFIILSLSHKVSPDRRSTVLSYVEPISLIFITARNEVGAR